MLKEYQKNYKNIAGERFNNGTNEYFLAKNIIGLHGAGFIDLILIKGSNVLELDPLTQWYDKVAIQCGFNYNCILIVENLILKTN